MGSEMCIRDSSSGAHHSSASGRISSSSSKDSDRIRGKRQVVPSLVEVASSAELLGRLTIVDNRVKPVSSNAGHARSAATEAASAASKAKHICLYVTTPLKDIDRVSTLPFSSSVNHSEATQQLISTTKSYLSDIISSVMSAIRKACAPPHGSQGGNAPSSDLLSGPSRLPSRQPPPFCLLYTSPSPRDS